MKATKILTILVLALGLMVCPAKVTKAAPMGTGFTYQGWLMDRKKPANDIYDFQFALYDDPDPNVGMQVGTTLEADDVNIVDGHFTLALDFGSSVFDGNAIWLETAVRPGDSNDVNDFVTLIPWQEITPVPYALQTRGIFVDPNGNVGIGTTSPQAALDINGSFNFLGGSGDVTGNGTLSAVDASWVMQYLSGTRSFSVRERADADINGDGQIDTLDAELIANVAVGNITLEEAHHGVGKFFADSSFNIDYDGNVGVGTTNPSERLHVVGNIRIVDGNEGANRVLTSDANGVARWQAPPILPRGVIVMWSGSIDDIPNGWALCDGNDGTPDLTSRFIRSVPNSSTDPGSTGGSTTHSHGAGSYSASSHTHSYSGTTSEYTADSCCAGSVDAWIRYTNIHSHTYSGTTSSSGGGAISGTSDDGSSLPPYYELAFIMKL